MQINILFPGRIALLVEDRVNNRVVCIHQQDALGLAHLQLVKITLRRLRITVCQHIRECKQIAAELVRHFALCLVGIAQRLDIGALHLGALMWIPTDPAETARPYRPRTSQAGKTSMRHFRLRHLLR